MSCVKAFNKTIDCCVVILYRKSCKINVPNKLVDNNGKAIKKMVTVNSSHNIKVRHVCNAICSRTTKNMKKNSLS